MTDRITYWIDNEGFKIEVVGDLAFEMYGSKFGIHKEIIKGKWGNHDEFCVTDILTGREICTCLQYEDAIELAKKDLEQRGEKEYMNAVKKVLNP